LNAFLAEFVAEALEVAWVGVAIAVVGGVLVCVKERKGECVCLSVRKGEGEICWGQ
jgi:hypothetical protein